MGRVVVSHADGLQAWEAVVLGVLARAQDQQGDVMQHHEDAGSVQHGDGVREARSDATAHHPRGPCWQCVCAWCAASDVRCQR
jgi:hypothetical protein